MTWNSPGGNNKDPWGNRNKQDGPPDIDDIVKNLWKKISGSSGSGTSSGGNGKGFLVIGLVVLALIWAFKGIYTVNEQERGVIRHFGEYDRTVGSGLGWIPYGVETIEKVNVNTLRETRVQGVMLSKDLNIIDVEIGIQYRVAEPTDFLFQLSVPEDTLQHAAESALRQVVGDSKVDALLTTEKERIRIQLHAELEEILDNYRAGLKVEQLTLEKAAPPPALNDAFEDVNRAEQDAKRAVQDAEAYRNKNLPLAIANAEQVKQQADAYKAEAIAKSNGEVSRFQQLLPQYEAAPRVTRDRLYIEMMEEVLSNSSKVMIDVDGGQNMLYLPLDQIIKNKKEATNAR